MSSRPLGVLEQSILDRAALKHSHYICDVVEYPSNSAPSFSTLSSRVVDFQRQFPALCANYDQAAKTVNEGQPWRPEDVVFEEQLEKETIDILTRRVEEMELRYPTGPLWRVTLTHSGLKCYVSFAINHALSDGMGSLYLVETLLGSNREFDRALPPTFESVVAPAEPPKPSNPTSLPSWPSAAALRRPPLDCAAARTMVSLSSSTLTKLLAVAKTHGTTLNPVLCTAFLLSVFTNLNLPPSSLTSLNAKSFRTPSLPKGTGLFFSGFSSTFDFPSSFWNLVSEFPPPLPQPILFPSGLPTPEQLFASLSSPQPYKAACMITNLLHHPLPSGATDWIWGQSGNPWMGAIVVMILGHEGGLRATLNWREGCILDKAEVDRIAEGWIRALTRLSEGWEEGELCK